jgi:hypothetical protein
LENFSSRYTWIHRTAAAEAKKKIFNGDTVENFPHAFFMPLLPREPFTCAKRTNEKTWQERKNYITRRIDTETQGDNFILIFWVNTRIINLDYEGELKLFLLLLLFIVIDPKMERRCMVLPYVARYTRQN